jgi:Ca2+-binding RTX toxin-like protein
MTTYTLTGFVLSYDSNDNLTSVAETTAQITSMDEHNSAFSYSIAMSPSGEVPYVYLGLTEIAQFYVEDYGNLSRHPGTFADYRLGQISGGGFSGVTLSIDNVNIQKSYVFSLGGDQIGPFSSTADVLNFNKQIKSAGTATGDLAPGAAIPLEDLPFTSVTEDDSFWAYDGESYASGLGDDVAKYDSGVVTFDGGAGIDTLHINDSYSLSRYSLDLTDGALTISRSKWQAVTIQNVEVIELNVQNYAGDPSVQTYSYDDLRIMASDTAVLREGTETADNLNGNSGDDTLVGLGGNDTLDGGDGKDTLNAGDGDDVIYGGTSAYDLRDTIYAGAGNDLADGGYGNDLIFGMDGDDTLNGGYGVDELNGQAEDDVLNGAAWSDALNGGAGNDYLNGGFGYDRLNGGEGADRFYHLGVAGHGSDWVQDYRHTDGDVLLFGQSGATKADFTVIFTETQGAGQAGVDEAFVIYKPTQQIIWALVDGAAEANLTLQVTGAAAVDLL